MEEQNAVADATKKAEKAAAEVATLTAASSHVIHANATGGCKPAGHLQIDFGGDVVKFTDSEQAQLHTMVAQALGLSDADLQVTRHQVDATVNIKFKFGGRDPVEHGYAL